MASGSNKRQRPNMIAFRTNDEETTNIKGAALIAGVSTAEFCRKVAVELANKINQEVDGF